MEKENKIDKVKDAIDTCTKYVKENSITDAETITCNDTKSMSKVEYHGPDGDFTVKLNKKTQQATADVHFTTGTFKSTVTESDCKSKGTDPVYNPFWGIFHQAFNQ